MEILKIDKSLVFDINEDIHELKYFNDLINNKKSESRKKFNNFSVTYFNINLGKQKILLMYYDKDKTILNPFSISPYDYEVFYLINDNEIVRIPFPFKLELETFNVVNFDFELVSESFNVIDPLYVDEMFEFINLFLLNCLQQFDRSNDKRFLFLSKELYNITYENLTNENNKTLFFINHLQTISRLEEPIFPFAEKISELIISFKKDSNILFAIYTVTKSKELAIYHHGKLKEEEIENLKQFPIYKLYQDLITD